MSIARRIKQIFRPDKPVATPQGQYTPPGTKIDPGASFSKAPDTSKPISSPSNPTPPGTRINPPAQSSPSRSNNRGSGGSSSAAPSQPTLAEESVQASLPEETRNQLATPTAPIGMSNGAATTTGGSFGVRPNNQVTRQPTQAEQMLQASTPTGLLPQRQFVREDTTRGFKGRDIQDEYDRVLLERTSVEFIPSGDSRQLDRGTIITDRPARRETLKVTPGTIISTPGEILVGIGREAGTGATKTVAPNLNVQVGKERSVSVPQRRTLNMFGGGADDPQEKSIPLQLTPGTIGSATGAAVGFGSFFVPVLGPTLAVTETTRSVAEAARRPSISSYGSAGFNLLIGGALGLRGAARERVIGRNIPEPVVTSGQQIRRNSNSFLGTGSAEVRYPTATETRTSFIDNIITPEKPFVDKVIRPEQKFRATFEFGGQGGRAKGYTKVQREGSSIINYDSFDSSIGKEVSKDLLLKDTTKVEDYLLKESQGRSGGIKTDDSSRLFFPESTREPGVPLPLSGQPSNPNLRRLRQSDYSQDIFIRTGPSQFNRQLSFSKVDPVARSSNVETFRVEQVSKQTTSAQPRASGNTIASTGRVEVTTVPDISDFTGSVVGSRGGTKTKQVPDSSQIAALSQEPVSLVRGITDTKVKPVEKSVQDTQLSAPRIVGGEGREQSPFYGRPSYEQETQTRPEVSLGFSTPQSSKRDTVSGINLISGQLPRATTRERSSQRSSSGLISGQDQSQGLGFGLSQPQASSQSNLQAISPIVTQRPRVVQRTGLGQSSSFGSFAGGSLGRSFYTPRPPTIRGPRLDNDDDKKKKKMLEFGFIPEVKVDGEYVPISNKALTRTSALNLGIRTTDTSLSRSFRLRPTKALVESKKERTDSNLFKFRTFKQEQGRRTPLTNEFIERSKFSLEGEEQSIIKPLASRARKRRGLGLF